MDALKGKKLVMKEGDGKALAATIKVNSIKNPEQTSYFYIITNLNLIT